MESQRREKNGFSLMELSAVVFLMILVLGIALPRFSLLFDSELQKETNKIAQLITNLRLQAILTGQNYKLAFDTKKSSYSVFTSDARTPHKFSPHKDFLKPVRLKEPIEIQSIRENITENDQYQFAGRAIEFDKIFGQVHEFMIDSSGFVDLFTMRLTDRDKSISLTVINIMGELKIGNETSL